MLNVDMQAATMALAGIGGLILLLLLVYIVILHKKIRKLETNYTFFMQDETGASVEAKLRDDVDKLHNLAGDTRHDPPDAEGYHGCPESLFP